jgi:hypothetical protein
MNKNSNQHKFTAVLKKHGDINAAYIEFPFDVEELFGSKGQIKVKALIDGKATYRGSLVKMGFDCHVLGITQEIRKDIGKSFGDPLNIVLEQDLEDRVVVIPEDVQKIFTKNKGAHDFYNTLSYTDRKEYMRWIESAKKDETRKKRLGLLLVKLKSGKKLVDK